MRQDVTIGVAKQIPNATATHRWYQPTNGWPKPGQRHKSGRIGSEVAYQVNAVVIDFFSLIVLLMIRTGLRRGADMDRHLMTLTDAVIWAMVAVMIIDPITWLCDGLPGPGAHLTMWVTNLLVQLIVPIPPLIWYLIVNHLARPEHASSRVLMGLVRSVYCLVAALVITNPVTRLLFTIDAGNSYRRGPLFLLIFSVSAVFLLLSAIKVCRHRTEYSLDIMMTQFFWAPPLAAGVLQIFVPGVNLVVPSIVLCILAFYTSMMARSSRLDYLTGAHTRSFLNMMMHQKMRGRTFGAMMLDVDQFKRINDRYGHLIGDEVLIGVASALKMSVRRNDCVVRYGGDEFVLIIDTDDAAVVDAIISRISRLLNQFNESSVYPFNVSLSIGRDLYRPANGQTMQQFIAHIDRLMYADKEQKTRELPTAAGSV